MTSPLPDDIQMFLDQLELIEDALRAEIGKLSTTVQTGIAPQTLELEKAKKIRSEDVTPTAW